MLRIKLILKDGLLKNKGKGPWMKWGSSAYKKGVRKGSVGVLSG